MGRPSGPEPDAIVTAIIEQMRERRRHAQEEYRLEEAEAAELEVRAGDRLAEAGAQLVPARDRWSPGPELAPYFDEADRLVERVADIHYKLDEKTYRPMHQQLNEERERASARLRWVLIQVAQAAGGEIALRISQLRPMYEDAARLQAEADARRAKAVSLRAEVAQIERDLAERSRGLREAEEEF
jgi:hypothetical protein